MRYGTEETATKTTSMKSTDAAAKKKTKNRTKEMGEDFAKLDRQFFKNHGISITEYIDRQRTSAAHSPK
jgi:hypothetical protein